MDLMNLSKLREERDQVSEKDFSISVLELCQRYEALYTGAINDVLRERLLLNQALPSEIMPLREHMKVAGIAFTIKSSADPTTVGEMETRARMLDDVYEHAICVWDTSGDREASQWGEMMTATVKRKGVRGAVVDGGLRDTQQVLRQEFPVFYRYRTSNGSLARCKITSYQTPIIIGKVIIKPGDVIFGDIDGVLVIPRDIAVEVLLRAEEIKANEKTIKDWVAEGVSVQEVVKRGGYF